MRDNIEKLHSLEHSISIGEGFILFIFGIFKSALRSSCIQLLLFCCMRNGKMGKHFKDLESIWENIREKDYFIAVDQLDTNPLWLLPCISGSLIWYLFHHSNDE